MMATNFSLQGHGVKTRPRTATLPLREADGRCRLEPTCVIDPVRPLAENLKSRVIGQDAALDALICSFSRILSGLNDPARPLLTALLPGPTGVGKTETAKALAQLFGSDRAMTRVNCAEYAHGHEIAKLLGSPPGYVGHDIEPLLSQHFIDEPHQRLRAGDGASDGLAEEIFPSDEGKYLSVVLFDEIEKAHPVLWNALLGILEDGMLTLGDNSTKDFTRSIILMTSNVGSRELSELLDRRPMGFVPKAGPGRSAPADVREVALAAAKRKFPFEFLNRFDEILVYSPLEREDLERIFDKILSEIHQRTLEQAGVPILIKVSPEAKSLIIDRGTDVRFGARPLRRAMERELVDPLSRFIASKKLDPGDVVEIEKEGDRLAFYRRFQFPVGLVV